MERILTLVLILDSVSFLDRYYIITTKQERFVRAILDNANISCPPPDRLFGLENTIGSKIDILLHLQRTKTSSQPIHFVEDRIETLEKISNVEELKDVRLYLAGIFI